MGKSKDTPGHIERRAQVARLYVTGKLQNEIAAELSISTATVSRDIQDIREGWKQSALFDFHEALGHELARLDEIEREAWATYRESKNPTIRTSRVTSLSETKDGIVKTTRIGDPRYLQLALECGRERAKLCGLITEKHHHTGVIAINARELTDAELEAIATGRGE